jgi:hypothetical protein
VQELAGARGVTMERHDGRTVMHDPEGNDFCVESGPAGR